MRPRKTLSIVGALSIAFLIASSSQADISRVTISVNGLACPFCVYGLEKKLKKVDGVESVEIDLKTGKAVLTLEKGKAPNLADFRTAVKKAGFTAGEIKVTAVGTVALVRNQVRLKLRNSRQEYLLFDKNTKGATSLSEGTRSQLLAFAEKQTVVAITGALHEHADGPSGLSVDEIEPVRKEGGD